MVSPTFGGGHQMEMQFGAAQINMQQMPPPSGHQIEMLRQPPPTNVPPPQMNSNQFPSAVTGQNLTPDTPGEHQMESQQQEQTGQESERRESDMATKPVEPSAAENDDSDKMDICDTWEQEKVQRLAEEVEKFEKEVMNIEKNSSKTTTDGTPAETSNNTTEAERTVDTDTTMATEKDNVDEVKKVDTDLSRDSKVVREAKEDSSHTNDSEVKNRFQEEGTEESSKVEANSREREDSEAKHPTTEPTDNPTSEQNVTPAEGTNVEQETEQNKKIADEKSIPAAETNETASFDDAMDLQVSSPEPFDEPAPKLTTDNA